MPKTIEINGRRLALATLNKQERAFAKQWGDIPAIKLTAKRAPLLGSMKATLSEKLAIAALSLTVAGCAAALYFLPHHYELAAYTVSGDRYVAGSGDTCNASWEGAVFPDDWKSIRCELVGGF